MADTSFDFGANTKSSRRTGTEAEYRAMRGATGKARKLSSAQRQAIARKNKASGKAGPGRLGGGGGGRGY